MKDRVANPGPPRVAPPDGRAADALPFTFEQFRSGLYRYLLRRLHNAENAEDLAQEVYLLRLLRAVDLGGVKCPQAYVYRIAFNVLYEFRLRERDARVVFDSRAASEIAEHLPDDASLPEAEWEDRDRVNRLEKVMGQLPPMQRAVLRLAAHHHLAHAEIAAHLGISVSTVRNHLYKAIDYCRHNLTGAP